MGDVTIGFRSKVRHIKRAKVLGVKTIQKPKVNAGWGFAKRQLLQEKRNMLQLDPKVGNTVGRGMVNLGLVGALDRKGMVSLRLVKQLGLGCEIGKRLSLWGLKGVWDRKGMLGFWSVGGVVEHIRKGMVSWDR